MGTTANFFPLSVGAMVLQMGVSTSFSVRGRSRVASYVKSIPISLTSSRKSFVDVRLSRRIVSLWATSGWLTI